MQIKGEHIERSRPFYCEMDVCGREAFFDCQRKREDYQQVVKCSHVSGQFELPSEFP